MNSEGMKRITVTCAIIMKEKNILACRRGSDSEHAHEWEFPGGKVEPFETVEECLIRELKEELDIEVEISARLKSVEYDYPLKKIELIPFICKIVKGEPTPLEHSKICWLSVYDFEELKWSAADRKLFYTNLNQLL